MLITQQARNRILLRVSEGRIQELLKKYGHNSESREPNYKPEKPALAEWLRHSLREILPTEVSRFIDTVAPQKLPDPHEFHELVTMIDNKPHAEDMDGNMIPFCPELQERYGYRTPGEIKYNPAMPYKVTLESFLPRNVLELYHKLWLGQLNESAKSEYTTRTNVVLGFEFYKWMVELIAGYAGDRAITSIITEETSDSLTPTPMYWPNLIRHLTVGNLWTYKATHIKVVDGNVVADQKDWYLKGVLGSIFPQSKAELESMAAFMQETGQSLDEYSIGKFGHKEGGLWQSGIHFLKNNPITGPVFRLL
jgi:hypothetical protein